VIAAIQNLESVFNEIARTRMIDIPILNPALRVEAAGFRVWEGRRVGVLVTPWMINLVILPGIDAPLPALTLDEKKEWAFPSGRYEFMGLHEPAIGPCHICSLISPVAEFSSHEEALAVAVEISISLFTPPPDELAGKIEEARLKGEAISQQNMSRREFLRMPLLGGRDA
jgi:[NiFe] hydrogenase assembly HybE family chaperone